MVSSPSPLFLEIHKHVQCTEAGAISWRSPTVTEWTEMGNNLVLGITNATIWLKSTLVFLLACLMVRSVALYFKRRACILFMCTKIGQYLKHLSWNCLWSEEVLIWVLETGLKGVGVWTRRGQGRGNEIIVAKGSPWSEAKGKCSARDTERSKSSGDEVTNCVKKWVSRDLGQGGARLGSHKLLGTVFSRILAVQLGDGLVGLKALSWVRCVIDLLKTSTYLDIYLY